MLTMLQAHGLDAGPTQRPLLAGGTAGLIATAPALAVMIPLCSPDALAGAMGIPVRMAILVFSVLLMVGGVLFGALFQRAANDVAGGWLLGLSFGFVLWMVGPIPLLQWLPNEPTLRGYPAAGLLLGYLLWGLTLGIAFPVVHRRLYVRLDHTRSEFGPAVPSRRAGLLDARR
jgi:hypothetical protein